MEWFKEKWLNPNLKALGIYMPLLYIRFVQIDKEHVKECISEKIGEIVKDKDKDEVREAVEEFFIEKVCFLYYSEREEKNKVLEELEKKYYEKFKTACYKYLENNIIIKIKK